MPSTRFHPPLAAALFGLLSVACTPVPLRSPAQGGQAWTELTSKHLVLSTDVAGGRAKEMLARFELMYDALASQVPHYPVDPAGRIDLVVFEDRRDFVALTGQAKGLGAYFQNHPPGDLEAHPVMVMSEGVLASDNMSTFLHELTHRFVRETIPRAPTWLNEGLAEYFETLVVEDGHLLVGEPITGTAFTDKATWSLEARVTDSSRWLTLQTQIPTAQAPSLEQLFGADPATFYAARHEGDVSEDDLRRQKAFYAGAWKLVHLFMNGPNREDVSRFKTFLSALSGGARQKDAFATVFGDGALPRLEKAYRASLVGSNDVWRVKYAPPEPAPPERERTMSEAETHILWARLRPWSPATTDAVTRHLEAAIAAEPGSPEPRYRRAIFELHLRKYEDARKDLAAALALRPAEPRFLLGQILLEDAQYGAAPPALVDRLAAAAVSAEQLDLVARCRASGSPDQAMELARRSTAADPTCWRCQDTLSNLLAAKGMLEEALVANERASALLPEGATVTALAKRHHVLEEALRASRVAPAPPKPPGPH